MCSCGWLGRRLLAPAERADAKDEWLQQRGVPALLAAENEPPSWLVAKSNVLGRQVLDLIDSRPDVALKLLALIEQWHRPLTEQAVAAARNRGASWADVGAALGVSRQAAHERFRNVNLVW